MNSLFWSTLLLGFLMLFLGSLFWKNKLTYKSPTGQWLLFSKLSSYVLFGGALTWFLYHVSQLGEPDFGQYKQYLLVLFGGVGVLAFRYVPEFLGVRGLAILTLLGVQPILQSAFLQNYSQRMFLVSIVYLFIVLALYVGTIPFALRDFFEYLEHKPVRSKQLGATLVILGGGLTLSAFPYLF